MGDFLPEEELIEYAKPYLKNKGYKKKNKRWTKEVGAFTVVFFIQGSCFSKEDYYIRPGVFINAVEHSPMDYYGHFDTQIEQTTPQKVMEDFEAWSEEWTNKALIKKRLLAFIKWDERYPCRDGERKCGLISRIFEPKPEREFLGLTTEAKQYILKNF